MRHQIFQSNRSHNITACQLYVRILYIRSRTAHGSHRIQHALARSRQRHTHTVTRTDNRYIRRIVLYHAHHYLRLVRHFFQTTFNNVLHLNRCFTEDRHITDKRHRNRTCRADHLFRQLRLLRITRTGRRQSPAEQHSRRSFPNRNVQHITDVNGTHRSIALSQLGQGLAHLSLIKRSSHISINIYQFHIGNICLILLPQSNNFTSTWTGSRKKTTRRQYRTEHQQHRALTKKFSFKHR